ncbi:MAG: hypothetical protein R3Y60_00215 [bacterium]
MKKGKSFICSVLELIALIVVMSVCFLVIDSIYGLILGAFLCGLSWMTLEKLEEKGKFEKIDNKINDTVLFQFFSRHRKAVYIVLFAIALLLTLTLF